MTNTMQEIDYRQFTAPPGHLSVTTIDAGTSLGNTAMVSCADAKRLDRATRTEVAKWTPAERAQRYELAKHMLAGKGCRDTDGEYVDQIVPLALIYIAAHPDKHYRKQLRAAVRDGLAGNGCCVTFTNAGDHVAVMVQHVRARCAA